jgi:hypothetical protein
VTLIKNNLNIGWYGGCDSCEDFEFYKSNGTLVDDFNNVIQIMQIKEEGYSYATWSSHKNEKQKEIWAKLPQTIRDTIDRLDFFRNEQGIKKLKCGIPYIIEVNEGSEINIPNFYLSGSQYGDAGRVIECYDCPTFPPCVCE